jgi:hypothetical protein
MKQGDQFMRTDDAEQALRAYQSAHGIMAVPTTGIAVVRALTKLGRLVEARDVALQVIRHPLEGNEPGAWVAAREQAVTASRDLESRIAGIVVRVEGDHTGLHVLIDGLTLANSLIGLERKVDPGNHVALVSADGFREARFEVSLSEGETREINVRLEPIEVLTKREAPPSPPSLAPVDELSAAPFSPAAEQEPSATPRVLLIGGASAAGLGLVVGSVAGTMSLMRTSDLKSTCPNAGCPADQQRNYDSAHILATVSNIAFAVGALGAVVGAYGYYWSVTDDKRDDGAGVKIWPMAGLGGAGLHGAF